MATSNEEIFNTLIRHQVYLERYKKGVLNKLTPILQAAIDSVLAKIAKVSGPVSRERLEIIARDLQQIYREMSIEIADQLKGELIDLMKQEVTFTQESIQKSIPEEMTIKVGKPHGNSLAQLVTVEPLYGQVLEKWAKQIGQSAADKSRQQILIGMAEGESIPKISKRLRFVGDQSKANLEMVTRTAVNHVSNQAKKSVYAANKDVLKGVVWRATLDGRTSAICRGRDGTVYPVDDHPTPPAHPSCRSTIVPLIKSFRDLGYNADDVPEGTRASMNGQVPSSETYNTWLRKQPKSFVEEVLGKEKARIYLEGKLSLDKFVDNTGKTLTIQQLKAKL